MASVIGLAITRHPLAAFFALAFGLNWVPTAVLAGPGGPVDGASFPVWLLVLSWAPGLAAIVVVLRSPEASDRRDLVRRIRTMPLPARWPVAAAALTAAAAGLGTLLLAALGATGGLPLGTMVAWPVFLLAALGEEVGWRGFALPRLLGLGAFRASVVLGTLWGTWHVPFMVATPGVQNVTTTLAFVAQCVGLSLVISWTLLRTRGSVLSATIVHAAWNVAISVGSSGGTEAGLVVALPMLAAGLALWRFGGAFSASTAIPRVAPS